MVILKLSLYAMINIIMTFLVFSLWIIKSINEFKLSINSKIINKYLSKKFK
jgi:hypothetical protein